MEKNPTQDEDHRPLRQSALSAAVLIDQLRVRNTRLVGTLLDVRASLLTSGQPDREVLVYKIDAAIKEVVI